MHIVVVPIHHAIEPAELRLEDRELHLQEPVPAPFESCLYVLLPQPFSLRHLDNTLHQLVPDRWKDITDSVVLRVHQGMAAHLSQDELIREQLQRRLPGHHIYMLYYSPVLGRHRIRPLSSPGPAIRPEGVLEEELISAFRAAEFRFALFSPGAILPATDDFHYEAPNGKHYRRYLRAGYAFASLDALDGASFWLIPHIPPGSLLLLDSWTMMALGLRIPQYLAMERILRVDQVPTVECRESYDEPLDTMVSRVAAALRLRPWAPIVCLVSVHSSGTMADALRSACLQVGLKDFRMVYLFSASPTLPSSGTVVHHVEDQIQAAEGVACENCLEPRLRSPVVRILPTTHLLELSASVEEARITANDASEVRRFFESYPNAGCFRIHRQQHDDKRHHMIDVDISPMLSLPRFQQQVRTALASWIGRDKTVVISTTHPGALELGRFVAHLLRGHFIPRDQSDLATLQGTDWEALAKAQSVLLVDDVSITGTRLRQYRAALSELGVVGAGADPEVGCFVGLARPASQNAWVGTRDMTDRDSRGRPAFYYAERLILPDWRLAECPWCDERRSIEAYLKDARKPGEDLEILRRRLDALADVSEGLTKNLFLPWTPGSAISQQSREFTSETAFHDYLRSLGVPGDQVAGFSFVDLGPKSVFGELNNEVDIFVAVASALQTMRYQGRLSEQFQTPIAKVLSPELYFTGRFYAQVLTAAILRAAQRHDLRATSVENRLRSGVGSRLNTNEEVSLRGEILWSISQGKLPLVSEAGEDKTFAAGNSAVRGFLRSVLGFDDGSFSG